MAQPHNTAAGTIPQEYSANGTAYNATAPSNSAQPAPQAKRAKAPYVPMVTGDQLAAFCETLDSFTPTIPDEVILYYLRRAGVDTSDKRVLRMISLATQKFVADVAIDSLAYHNQRNPGLRRGNKDKPKVLTMTDLTSALAEQGITAARPPYYV